MSLRVEIAGFIRDKLIPEGQSRVLEEDESLIERGVIDSMGLFQLMMFLEERTGIRIPDTEVTLENFDSVAKIERLILRLRGEGARDS